MMAAGSLDTPFDDGGRATEIPTWVMFVAQTAASLR